MRDAASGKVDRGWQIIDGFVELYQTQIIDTGKQALFLLLIAFIVTFLFIRLSVRMIRAGVSWWSGNISSGDGHMHHVVSASCACSSPACWRSRARAGVAPEAPRREPR